MKTLSVALYGQLPELAARPSLDIELYDLSTGKRFRAGYLQTGQLVWIPLRSSGAATHRALQPAAQIPPPLVRSLVGAATAAAQAGQRPERVIDPAPGGLYRVPIPMPLLVVLTQNSTVELPPYENVDGQSITVAAFGGHSILRGPGDSAFSRSVGFRATADAITATAVATLGWVATSGTPK